jgi:hypothetical protein
MSLDQREIQKKGGKAAKFPSAYIIADILKSINAQSVLDVTYGKGRFYAIYRPNRLIGADPKKWDWIVEPDEFYQVPVWKLVEIFDGSADVVVCDPPRWNMDVQYNKRGEYNYIIGTPELIIKYATKIAKKIDAYLLLHYNKLLNLPVERDVQMRWIARYLNSERPSLSHYTLYFVP